MEAKKYFLTFGNDSFKFQTKRIAKQARETKWFDKIIIETPESIKTFVDEHKYFIDNNLRGYGYYIWKPYIIHKLIENINEGDLIFFIDSGGTLLKHKEHRLKEYITLLNSTDKPIITFSVYNQREVLLQKLDVLKAFTLNGVTLDKNENFLNSFQIESGVIIIKKCKFTTNLIKTWMEYGLKDNYKYFTDASKDDPQLPEFGEHRHDQSILSILCKINNTLILPTEAYGEGPFFSSRLTDEGPRNLAPDIFRTLPDYLNNVHFIFKNYVEDVDVIESTLNSIKDCIIQINQSLVFDDVEKTLKDQFFDKFVPFIEDIQTHKGLYSVKLTIDEFHIYSALSRNWLVGSFELKPTNDREITLYFELTPNKVEFNDTPIEVKQTIQRKFFTVIYQRVNDFII